MNSKTSYAALLALMMCMTIPASAEDETVGTEQARIVAEDGPVTPTTGEYLYDPSGNIIAIGSSSYSYDPMSRLVTAAVSRFGNVQAHTYTYDAYGNRINDGVTAYTASTTTNRLTALGAQYDAAGNLTEWQPPNSPQPRRYDYDALNTLMMERVAVSGGEDYVAHIYTADDERYWSFRGGVLGQGESRYSLRDLDGRVLREFSETTGGVWSARDYVYRDGHLVASHDTSMFETHHYSLDHLGTPRIVTNDDAEKIAEHTYFPFGAEYTDNMPSDGRLHFTGHEQRDADLRNESRGELDYMHARFYSSAGGRFVTMDPVMGNLHRPQSFNAYSYAANDPLKYFDPDGRQMQISLSFTWPEETALDGQQPTTLGPQFWRDFYWFAGGVANSFGSNALFGRGRVDFDGNRAYGAGQFVGDLASMVAGAAEINAGFGGSVGGFFISSTGIGAVAGVPVQVMSGALLAHGGVTTAIAATHFMSGIKQRKFGKHGTFRGRDSKRSDDSAFYRVVRELDLDEPMQQRLHHEISGGDLSYEEIRDVALALFF